ncbi:MAG: hypothetical protein KDD29_01160 [Flavobacteriales bacterium]|nr:hypothetical protein [Flavobacteriales bacterium]
MKVFNYNSRHKIITGVIILFLAVYSFTGNRETTIYGTNGRIKQTGNIVNGKNHGKWIWYYSNGKKKMEGSFDMGLRVGEWKTYNQNEKIISSSFYQNDQLNGISTTWNSDGVIISKKKYINDKEVTTNYISSNR